MRSRSDLPVLVLALAALVGAPASAANPKLSLKLEAVTCRQAVDALVKATGVPINLNELRAGPGAAPRLDGDQTAKRASFDWSKARLGQALRELCREFDLDVNRFSGNYSLLPNRAAPGIPAAKPKVVFQKDGLRIYPSSLSVSSNRTINFERDGEPGQNSNLNLRLKVEWPDGDPETLAGFDNVVARDDLGNLLEYQQRLGGMDFGGLNFGSRFPDEWSGNVNLSDQHPRARKIQWLEGDLLVYKVYRSVRLEVPLAEKSTTGAASSGLVKAQILGIDPAIAGGGGPTLRARLFVPRGEHRIGPEGGRMFSPLLIGASGKNYSSRGGGANGNGGDEGTTYTLNLNYPPIDEPVVKAVFTFVEKGEPQKLISFRLTGIGFPPDGVFVPRRLASPMPRPVVAAVKTERPFNQVGGGILVLRTEINGKPAGEGSLSVGLALKTGAEAGPVRWQEVDMGKDGLARLPDVTPGTYRLLRIYRPKAATVVEGEGRWENGESEVELVAGKEVVIRPLRWTLDAPSARPPARALPGSSVGTTPKKPIRK